MKFLYGWNVVRDRPGQRWEIFDNDAKHEVCLCSDCSSDPHYSNYHCHRRERP